MAFKIGIGEKRNALKVVLLLFGLSVMPITGDFLSGVMDFALGPVLVKQVLGALALVLVYLVQTGKV